MDSSGSEEDNSAKPFIQIIEQPKTRGYRFRYGCEGQTAGSIPGVRSTDKSKTVPAIKIGNIPPGTKVTVVASCVTVDDPHCPHPHKLVGRDCKKGVCTVALKRTATHQFQQLGVQCVKKKSMKESLTERQQIKVDPFDTGYGKSDRFDMKKIRLAFQAFIISPQNEIIPVRTVVSEPIHDHKADNELVICRTSRSSGQAKGGDEVFFFTEKVAKDDVQVLFEDDQGWEDSAEFNHNDVHKGCGIVFKTPPYKQQKITSSRQVAVRLYRQSDDSYSEPVIFTYFPNNDDIYGLASKRKRKLPPVSESNANVPNLGDLLPQSTRTAPSSTITSGAYIHEQRVPNTSSQNNNVASDIKLEAMSPAPTTSLADYLRTAATTAGIPMEQYTVSQPQDTNSLLTYPKLPPPEPQQNTPYFEALISSANTNVVNLPNLKVPAPIPAMVQQHQHQHTSQSNASTSTTPMHTITSQPSEVIAPNPQDLLNSLTTGTGESEILEVELDLLKYFEDLTVPPEDNVPVFVNAAEGHGDEYLQQFMQNANLQVDGPTRGRRKANAKPRKPRKKKGSDT